MARRPHLLLLNASLAGETGNTAVALARAARLLRKKATVETFTLANTPVAERMAQAADALARCDGLLIGTGTHWDSWSSVLQEFLEQATPTEGTALWLGKPAAVIVTEHSVGGKAVLSRLHGVLVTLGCAVPPMSGVVLSRAALLAAEHDAKAARDFWSRADLAVLCHNLIEAAQVQSGRTRPRWRAWSVDRTDFGARWLE